MLGLFFFVLDVAHMPRTQLALTAMQHINLLDLLLLAPEDLLVFGPGYCAAQ